MKKKLMILLISVFLLWGSVAFAGHAYDNFMYCLSSGEQDTDDTTIYTGTCFLVGVIILTDGANDATVILYDNTSKAGTKIWEAKVISSDNYGGGMFPYPIYCATGIHLALSGTGATCIIFYRAANSTYKIPAP